MTQSATFTHTYQLSGYPKEKVLVDGGKVTLRPMVTTDEASVLEFFRRVPAEDRYYLKEDVLSPSVIKQWADLLSYDRALPLLALDGSKVVADGTLHRRRSGARRHTAEIRLVVDPDYRGRGLGMEMLRALIDIAVEGGLEVVTLELAEDSQKNAIEVAERLGFVRAAILRDRLKSQGGKPENLVVMDLPLGKWYEWWQF
jgi:RimJ/RimL family protein N-acetyltransferase